MGRVRDIVDETRQGVFNEIVGAFSGALEHSGEKFDGLRGRSREVAHILGENIGGRGAHLGQDVGDDGFDSPLPGILRIQGEEAYGQGKYNGQYLFHIVFSFRL